MQNVAIVDAHVPKNVYPNAVDLAKEMREVLSKHKVESVFWASHGKEWIFYVPL